MTLPSEAEALLASAPEEFVEERKRVARELREAGRTDDAQEVAGLRKPAAVVLAANYASREHPKVAKAAAAAAAKLAHAQVSGDAQTFRKAGVDLEQALADLAEVAVARLSSDKPAGENMRRRAYDLLRAAVADESSRAALLRGALTEEVAFTGFEAFAGVAVPTSSAGKRSRAPRADAKKQDERRSRKRELRTELSVARKALRAASSELEQAQRSHEDASERVDKLERELDELERS